MIHRQRVRQFRSTAAAVAVLAVLGPGCSSKTSPSENPVLSSVSLASTTAVGGSTVQGTVNLTRAAGSGGAVVTLTSANTAVVTVPPNVTVAAGNTSATFTVTTKAVAAATPVVITGSFGGTQTATLNVTTGLVASFTVISPAQGGGVNRCLLNVGGQTLDCALNGTASSGPITSYTWTLTLATNVVVQSATTSTIATPSTGGCSLFSGQTSGGASQNLQMIVRLDVRDAAGNVATSTNNNVTVVPRAGACGF